MRVGTEDYIGEWELVYHDDHPNYYAHYVTARCSKCGNWFYGNENIPGHSNNKYGAKIWAGFCTNYGEDTKKQFELFALDKAKYCVDELPDFCCHCGCRMKCVS